MQWKAIDTDSEYEVSDTGLVRKVHIMKPYTDRDGYKKINIVQNGISKTVSIHRLLLHAFNPVKNEQQMEVHHIDGDPSNNNLSNLRWVTHEENIHLIPPDKLKSINQFIARSVQQFTLDDVLIQTFNSAYEAGKKTGCNHRHISEVCQNKRKTTGGFKWKYFEGSTTNSNKCYEKGDSTNVDEDIV